MRNLAEIKVILDKANNISNTAIEKILSKLNISSKELSFLNDIPLKMEILDEALAKYESVDNEIICSINDLQEKRIEILKAIKSENMDEKQKNKYMLYQLLEIANSLIHEKIHACRTVNTPSDKLNRTDYLDYYINSEPITTIFNKVHSSEETLPLVACDIDYDQDIKEIQDYVNDKTNFDERKFDNIIDERTQRLNQQVALEESITEALATMISLNFQNKYSSYSIEELSDYVIEKSSNDFVKAGAKIIKFMGQDMIEWFLTTAINKSQYKNLFKETFSENYDELLEIMLNTTEKSPKQLEELDSIIKENESLKTK